MDNAIQGLFSFRGRMSRSEFWLLSIGIGVLIWGVLMAGSMLVLAFVGPEVAAVLAPVRGVAQLILQLLSIWPTLAIMTKRGHDRNYPAAMSIGLWVAMYALFLISGAVGVATGNPTAAGLIAILGLLIGLYIVIDYGFFPGSRGRNRYDAGGPSRSVEREATASLFD
jgi:uncharacterized membrane protein YhaH (DUF805 family)